MNKLVPLLFVSLLISACSSPTYNYVPEMKNFSIPAVGDIATAGIGDYLLDEGLAKTSKALKLNSTFDSGRHAAMPGTYLLIGTNKEYEYYQQPMTSAPLIHMNLLLNKSPVTNATLRKTMGQNELCTLVPGDIDQCDTFTNYEYVTINQIDGSGYRRTLFYNGKTKDILAIGYREFSDDKIRAAFSNEVEYDLGESNLIGYKGARIEVINATNTEITYKVLQGFAQ